MDQLHSHHLRNFVHQIQQLELFSKILYHIIIMFLKVVNDVLDIIFEEFLVMIRVAAIFHSNHQLAGLLNPLLIIVPFSLNHFLQIVVSLFQTYQTALVDTLNITRHHVQELLINVKLVVHILVVRMVLLVVTEIYQHFIRLNQFHKRVVFILKVNN